MFHFEGRTFQLHSLGDFCLGGRKQLGGQCPGDAGSATFVPSAAWQVWSAPLPCRVPTREAPLSCCTEVGESDVQGSENQGLGCPQLISIVTKRKRSGG